jgi:hypothetical protein
MGSAMGKDGAMERLSVLWEQSGPGCRSPADEGLGVGGPPSRMGRAWECAHGEKSAH